MDLEKYTISELIKGVMSARFTPVEIAEDITRNECSLDFIKDLHKNVTEAINKSPNKHLQELDAALERFIMIGGVCKNNNINKFLMSRAHEIQKLRNAIIPNKCPSVKAQDKQTPQETTEEHPLTKYRNTTDDKLWGQVEKLASIYANGSSGKQTAIKLYALFLEGYFSDTIKAPCAIKLGYSGNRRGYETYLAKLTDLTLPKDEYAALYIDLQKALKSIRKAIEEGGAG